MWILKIQSLTKHSRRITSRALGLQWRHQAIDLRLQLIVQILVVGMLANEQRHRAAFHAHGGAQIQAARCVRVRHALVLADAGQMAHDLDGRHVAGENDDAVGSGGEVFYTISTLDSVVLSVSAFTYSALTQSRPCSGDSARPSNRSADTSCGRWLCSVGVNENTRLTSCSCSLITTQQHLPTLTLFDELVALLG